MDCIRIATSVCTEQYQCQVSFGYDHHYAKLKIHTSKLHRVCYSTFFPSKFGIKGNHKSWGHLCLVIRWIKRMCKYAPFTCKNITNYSVFIAWQGSSDIVIFLANLPNMVKFEKYKKARKMFTLILFNFSEIHMSYDFITSSGYCCELTFLQWTTTEMSEDQDAIPSWFRAIIIQNKQCRRTTCDTSH